MLSLTDYQIALLNNIKVKLEESLREGSGGSSLEVLPLYKYRDASLFDQPTFGSFDPSYPPYNTNDPSRRETLKLPFLNASSAIIAALKDFVVSYTPVTLQGVGNYGIGDYPILKVGFEATGEKHLVGAVIAPGTIAASSTIAILPPDFVPATDIWIVGILNFSSTVAISVNKYGILSCASGLSTSDTVYINQRFR